MATNPFGVYNPEQLDATYIARNFVDVYTDLPALRDRANTFILGARGTGKSMLLRSLEPEVMLISGKADSIADLPYLATHIPLRKAEFAVPELSKLAGYASVALGEHLLVMHSLFRLMGLLASLGNAISPGDATGFGTRFDELFALSSNQIPVISDPVRGDTAQTFMRLQRICEQEIMRVRQYFARLSFAAHPPEYHGALTGFLDFLIPLAEAVNAFKSLPSVPVFLMLDDADNLPRTMQQVLNSWVSTRSTHAVCLKITTQLGYATLRTVDNRVIESPHDFSEVNLAAVYTTDQDRYSKRIREIVARRLDLAGIKSDPDSFFPPDISQQKRLAEVEEQIRSEWEARSGNDEKRGSARVRDEVTRYAVPRLMRQLTGDAKSSHTYSYAGFKSLVDLSSGVVRWFLEPASRMFDREVESGGEVVSVPVGVQDEIIFEWSREFVQRLSEIAPSVDSQPEVQDPDASLHAFGHETIMYEKVRNLVDGLGRLFRSRLLDETAAEQRVFSVVVRGKMSDELKDVIGLAVRLGYLQTSDNAAKEALGGRLPRYVLARRLAPYYRLDVSGYAAHLSVHAQDLATAMRNPVDFVATRLKQSDDRQLALELDRG